VWTRSYLSASDAFCTWAIDKDSIMRNLLGGCLGLLLTAAAGCADHPTTPSAEAGTQATPSDGIAYSEWESVQGCGGKTNPCPIPPVNPNVPGPECDPWLDPGWCQGGPGWECIEFIEVPASPELAGLASCPPGGSVPVGPCPTWQPACSPVGGPGSPPGVPEVEDCDPRLHPDCEQPLTDQDTATINSALRTLLRAISQFTDATAREACEQMAADFRDALAEGDVYRGAFDSDTANDPEGPHYGAIRNGRIHFDPAVMDAANRGNAAALLELAITSLHEGAHRAGNSHPIDPTFDAQGRDYYVDAPFSHLNPGPNSCVPR
jgi:hypothetical protein